MWAFWKVEIGELQNLEKTWNENQDSLQFERGPVHSCLNSNINCQINKSIMQWVTTFGRNILWQLALTQNVHNSALLFGPLPRRFVIIVIWNHANRMKYCSMNEVRFFRLLPNKKENESCFIFHSICIQCCKNNCADNYNIGQYLSVFIIILWYWQNLSSGTECTLLLLLLFRCIYVCVCSSFLTYLNGVRIFLQIMRK